MIKLLAMVLGIFLSPATIATQTIHVGITKHDNLNNIVQKLNNPNPDVNLVNNISLVTSAMHNGAKILQNDGIFNSDQEFLTVKNIYVDEAQPISNDGWGLYWVSGSYLDSRAMDYKNYYGQLKLNEKNPNEIAPTPNNKYGKINYGIFPRLLNENALPINNYQNIWTSYAEFFLKWSSQTNNHNSKNPIIGARFKPLLPTKDGYMQTDATILYMNNNDRGRISTLKTHMVYDFWHPEKSQIISSSAYEILPEVVPKGEFDGTKGITQWNITWYGKGELDISEALIEKVFNSIDLIDNLEYIKSYSDAVEFCSKEVPKIIEAFEQEAALAEGVSKAIAEAIITILEVLPDILIIIGIVMIIVIVIDIGLKILYTKFNKGIKIIVFAYIPYKVMPQ